MTDDKDRVTLLGELNDQSESALTKYRRLFVGSQSIPALLKYEILTFFLSSLSGALGLVLRKVFYRHLFAVFGNGTVIGTNVTLRCPRFIELGGNNVVDDFSVLDAKGTGSSIRLGNAVLIGRDTVLSCSSARIDIGDDVSIGPQCYIRAGMCDVSIGSMVTIGAQVAIVSGTPGHDRSDVPMKSQVGVLAGIAVGSNVWIGVGAKLIDGVTIGDGAIIGAGAVVTRDVPPNSTVGGIPAKILTDRSLKSEN